jgi:Na+-translocating ferredoxin:NAD+ oxidoreductase subunit B
MEGEEQVYYDLSKHLDRQAVGFPATRSGAEIRLLQRLFTPEEARLALHLTYRPCSLQDIFASLKPAAMSPADLKKMLDGMALKGAIGWQEKENTRYYYTLPFVVGMFEGQLSRLTPGFLADFTQFTSERAFGMSMISTKLPQMRTIPVEKSLPVKHHVTTYDHLREIIEGTTGQIGVNECICRKSVSLRGRSCRKTTRLETCMCFGDMADIFIQAGDSRPITKAEALEIARLNEADGLVLQPSNSQKAEFICACCGCCCGMLGMLKMLPRPVEFWAANYYAVVDSAVCSGCGTCVERCQVNAVVIDAKAGVSTISLGRCIGCGNCVTSCPSGAMSLVKKARETVPPQDNESLYRTIAENRPGTLGKMKIIARLMLKK